LSTDGLGNELSEAALSPSSSLGLVQPMAYTRCSLSSGKRDLQEQDVFDGLSDTQETFLRHLYGEDANSARTFGDEWLIEAAETDLSFPEFLDVYLLEPAAHRGALRASCNGEGCEDSGNPFWVQLSAAYPSLGWPCLQILVSQLTRCRSMSLCKFRHHCPDTISDSALESLLRQLPNIFWVGQDKAKTIQFIWPQLHGARYEGVVNEQGASVVTALCWLSQKLPVKGVVRPRATAMLFGGSGTSMAAVMQRL